MPESGSSLYFSNARAQSAVVSQTITDGVTTTAPSENAVFDALALKSNAADVYTKTQLDAGQLDSRYFTETEVNTFLGTKANVSNPSFTGTLAVSGNVTAGNVSTNAVSATAITASSLAVSANVSAGNLAVAGKLTVNGAEWASTITYGTTTPFTYYGPGANYSNGVSFYAQTASNGTPFVTAGGTNNSVFTFTTAGTYLLQGEIETSYPFWPEGDITSFYVKNADSSTRFGAESHSPENFMTVAAGDNVRFVVDSSAANDYEAGIGSCRFTLMKLA